MTTVAQMIEWMQTLPQDAIVECKANARLMAAAPDLLDALEFVMNRLVDKHEDDIAAQKARAAIAKATGGAA